MREGSCLREPVAYQNLPKVLGVDVLKKVPNQSILEGRVKLALPELSGEGVPSVSDQEQILTGSGETRSSEPVEDEVP